MYVLESLSFSWSNGQISEDCDVIHTLLKGGDSTTCLKEKNVCSPTSWQAVPGSCKTGAAPKISLWSLWSQADCRVHLYSAANYSQRAAVHLQSTACASLLWTTNIFSLATSLCDIFPVSQQLPSTSSNHLPTGLGMLVFSLLHTSKTADNQTVRIFPKIL